MRDSPQAAPVQWSAAVCTACAVIALLSMTRARADIALRQIDHFDTPTWPLGPQNGPWVTNDIFVSTSTDWHSALLYLRLDTGTIFQNVAGTDTSPNTSLFATKPGLIYDTYVAGGDPGGLQADQPARNVIAPVGAADLSGNAEKTFSGQTLDVTWFRFNKQDIGPDRLLARVTLSDDATGTFQMLASSAATPGDDRLLPPTYDPELLAIRDGVIAQGVLSAPSPTLPGDMNQDGFIGAEDLSLLIANWNQDVGPGGPSDPFGDGFVGALDLAWLIGWWNLGVPATVAPPAAPDPVPEPHGMALASIMVWCLAGRGGRAR